MKEYIYLDNFDAEEVKIFARLNENQLIHYNEPELGIFIAESTKVILRALDDGYEPISFLSDEKLLDTDAKEVIERLPDDIPFYTGPFDILSRMTGYKITRGALCAMKRRELPSVTDVIKDARRIVVLDDVENPTNVGSIFRAAAALGMDAVILTKGCSDPLYRRAARVSVGTVFQMPWTYFGKNRKVSYLDELHELGFKTVAMALRDDSIRIDDPILQKEPKLAIIMGNEGYGLTDEVIEKSDYVITIPMAHGVDSLNVATASAVAFWELSK